MRHKLAVMILVLACLTPLSVKAQSWTCDDGPNDVLNAAQAAYDKGNYQQASELVTLAQQICTKPSKLTQIMPVRSKNLIQKVNDGYAAR